MRLENKTAIVTGGSRGIGFATVEAFLREGARVVLCASRQETAQRAVEKLSASYPDRVSGIWPDLNDQAAVQAAFDDVAKSLGRIDILVNNAGTADSTPFTDYTPDLFDRIMNLNINAMFHCSKAVCGHMIAQGGGVILNTSSMVSQYGQPSGIAYPTSKFAVNGFTVSLARELGPKGIRVNAVAPGITETDMMRSVPKSMIDPLIAQIPLRRLGRPEDIANAFVFLASAEASYITGVVLRVDGMAKN